MSTTDVLIEVLRNAGSIPARFVLFDSWFTLPQTVIRVKIENRDVIGMVRISEKIHYFYFYDGKWQNIKLIYSSIRSRSSGSSKIFGSVCVKIREQRGCELEECTDAKIVFIKEKRSKNWLAILFTDISLPDEEIIRIYGKRWDIEVFFKVCKSNLALSREFQGRSYDMLTDATVIVFVRYAMLSIEARNKSDDRTIGELFYSYCQELEDIRFSQALLLLLARLIGMPKETKPFKNKLQEKITELFLNALPSYLRCLLPLCA
ncbi:MAG: transposase [Candidatus Cloacimonetes bacterium]|nr:transposase [Candidatus Cloacimonadota bacterium]